MKSGFGVVVGFAIFFGAVAVMFQECFGNAHNKRVKKDAWRRFLRGR